MFVVIWEYEVRPGAEPAFEALYGSDGAWIALFRQFPGFLGTELLHDEGPGTYLTIDRWSSQTEYEAFLAAAKSRYEQIDAQGDAMTMAERRIGAYRGF